MANIEEPKYTDDSFLKDWWKSVMAWLRALNRDVKAETEERKLADEELQSNIELEVETRKSSDNELQINIDAEAETRKTTDEELQSNIELEVETRKTTDDELQSKIDTEVETRKTADTELQSNIDDKADNVTIGNLSDLKTSDKTNIVSAINNANNNICITIASETSSEKAKSKADFVIPNDETMLTKMQDAFNAVPQTGGEIHLCAGTYDFTSYAEAYGGNSSLVIQGDNTTISGEGMSTIFTQQSRKSETTMIQAENKINVCVRDIYFKVGDYTRGVYYNNCKHSTIINCRICLTNTDVLIGVEFLGGDSNRITNCTFYDSENNCYIKISGGCNCHITNNIFNSFLSETSIYLFETAQVLVQNNIINVSDDGCGISLSRDTSTACTGSIMNNQFYVKKGIAIQGTISKMYVVNRIVSLNADPELLCGGADGTGAEAGNGFSGGYNAKVGTDADKQKIDAIQLGTGTNSNPKTLQVYNKQITDKDGNLVDVGILSKLGTSNKSDIVTAINEEHSKRKTADENLKESIAEETKARRTLGDSLQNNLDTITRANTWQRYICEKYGSIEIGFLTEFELIDQDFNDVIKLVEDSREYKLTCFPCKFTYNGKEYTVSSAKSIQGEGEGDKPFGVASLILNQIDMTATWDINQFSTYDQVREFMSIEPVIFGNKIRFAYTDKSHDIENDYPGEDYGVYMKLDSMGAYFNGEKLAKDKDLLKLNNEIDNFHKIKCKSAGKIITDSSLDINSYGNWAQIFNIPDIELQSKYHNSLTLPNSSIEFTGIYDAGTNVDCYVKYRINGTEISVGAVTQRHSDIKEEYCKFDLATGSITEVMLCVGNVSMNKTPDYRPDGTVVYVYSGEAIPLNINSSIHMQQSVDLTDIKYDIGQLPLLETTAKGNLVSAINELKSSIGSSSGGEEILENRVAVLELLLANLAPPKGMSLAYVNADNINEVAVSSIIEDIQITSSSSGTLEERISAIELSVSKLVAPSGMSATYLITDKN